MRAQVEIEAPPMPQLPNFITQHLDPLSGDDDTADLDAGARLGAMMQSFAPLNIPQPDLPQGEGGAGVVEAPVSRNAPCPCGSGRIYMNCVV